MNALEPNQVEIIFNCNAFVLRSKPWDSIVHFLFSVTAARLLINELSIFGVSILADLQ